MKKIAQNIVKFRLIFAIIFAILTALGIYFSTLVKQNYDMSKYLQDDTDTKRGLAVMNEEFGLNNNILLMLSMDETEISAMKSKLSEVEGVQLVTLDSYKSGKALFLLTLSGDEYSAGTKETIGRLKTLLKEEEFDLSGSSVANIGLEKSLKVEIPIILAIALVIIFLVLLLTSHSWIEPLIFGLVLLCSVLINMGSNIIFGEISYVTFAVSAILQIALAMDYSIILLHGYSDNKDKGMSDEEALVEALAYNMKPISSSGLTTIAGLIALLFMSFTIGFDIGMVLAKGILVSLMCVLLFMPSLILLFSKPLQRTKHKPLQFGGAGVAKVSVSLKSALLVVMVIVIAGSYILQLSNTYTFTGWENDDGHSITETFGNVNQAVVIINNDYADDKDAQEGFINAISELSNESGGAAFKSINCWTNLELSSDAITDNLNLDSSSIDPIINAMFGTDPKIGDLVKVWNDCGGDIYEIELSQEALAVMMKTDVDDRKCKLVYGILKEDGRLTVGILVNKLYAINANPVLKDNIDLSDEMKKLIEIMHDNRDEVTAAVSDVLTPIVDGIDEKDLDKSIHDIDFDAKNGFALLNKVLFGEENFKVFEFYNMWKAANGNIADLVVTENMLKSALDISVSDVVLKMFMSMISSDGDVTVGELVQFIYEKQDRRLVKRVLNDQIIGACVLLYLTQDVYLPFLNEQIGNLLETLRSTFVGEKHSRIIMLMDLPKADDTTFATIDTMKVFANKYFGDDNLIAGESMTIKDVSDAFRGDLIKINLVTVISIFLIIAILFRSVLLPLLLVLVIQGAIWITMAICALFGTSIFFMSYIICVCIQMGATIDYGILIAGNYRRNRATMSKLDSIVQSLKTAMPTIFTSGLILIAAGLIVGFVSSVMPIYSIGRLLGLGTCISILLILFLLPGLLYLFDKAISRTTWDGVKPIKDESPRKKRKSVSANQKGEGEE